MAVVLSAAKLLFGVPFLGSLGLLLTCVTIFVLALVLLGYTISTMARTQLQAMQLTFFFFLPSLLLSGFMFPYAGMPLWAQWLGEIFPLSVRGIGSSFGSAANWLGNFIVSQFFLVLLDAFGNNVGGPFAIFGVFSALSIPFVLRLVPETKGKSLEEIEKEMTKR